MFFIGKRTLKKEVCRVRGQTNGHKREKKREREREKEREREREERERETWRTMASKEVPAKAEEALRSKMKHLAHKMCKKNIEDFVACSRKFNLAVVLACREENRQMNECTNKYTNSEVLEDIKTQWLKQGKPSSHEWMPNVKPK